MVQFTSDPTLADTDSDGVNDYFELSLGANPRFSDSDEDGLDDLSEQERGTRLTNFDTDGDGLSDYREVEETFGTFVYLFENFRVNSVYRIYNTNPLNADTDGDGVSDYDEVEIYQSVATTADSDQDSISDFDEIGNGTNLIHADTDGDLLSDGLELHGFEIPEISFTPGSYAEDGSVLVSPVLRQSTVIIYTDPTLFDTDGDGLSDSEELLGTPEISNPTLADSDGDGITDFRDPYPLIPDYAPPTFTTNSFGNEGITLTYGTGDSILSNVVESFKAAAEAVLGLVVDVGTLFVELLESLFYWKCVETFGECIYLPWLRSDAEIANRVRKALFKFATSSNERLAQIFPGYDATAQFVSRSISLNNFGVDVKTNDIGIPIDISVSGIMEMLASGAKKILEELINPTVNVYFAVEDSSGIDRVEVYVNGEYDRTISGNAQQLFFNEQFTIFAEDDGSTSTDFKFIIYDKIGNSIEIERTATVVDFVSGIANDIFKEVIDIVDVFSPWAADILAVAVTAVVDAAAFVAELALDALLFIINFVTEAVPALFEAFVHEIIGAYLDDKDYQAEQILSNLSQYYQNQRTAVVNAFDATAGAVAGNAQTGVEEIYNAITDYLPQLDEKSMLKELTGGSDFFELTDLDGTIFAFVIDYMQDEFMELFTSIINGYVEDIVESQLEQYIGPVMGLQHQILDMFGALSYDLGFGSSTSFGAPTSLNLANIKDAPSKVLDFIDSVTAPIELLSSIMDTISGENMMKVYDMFLISNPNIVYSLNDLLRAFVKPIFMLGLVTYDVISEVGELISPLSPLSPAARLDGIQTLAGIPLNALDLDMPQPSLDANDQAKALIIIRVIWKAAEHALDMAISLYVGQERYKTGRISGLTAGLEYTFRSMIFGVNLIFDIGVDILLERDPTTVVGSSFQGNLGRYVARAANFFIKGVFLSAVSFRLDPYIFTISNYDIVAAVLDVITVLSEIVITIIEIAEGATGADSIFNEWILALRIITITVTVVFTIANIITTTSFKLPSTAQAVYLGVWAVNQVLKWVTDLLIGIKLYNL
jgi:hypothetical protein